ncbi:MAG: thymidylate synthase [Thermoplasmata archaeon]|nr:MAG: thymidylate synthase [Thermoplasmata archaeon]
MNKCEEDHEKLRFEYIKAFSLPDAWYQCLIRIFESGHEYTIDRGSYEGQKRLEFDYITVQITNPCVKPLVPDIPEGLGVPPPSSMEYVEKYLEKIITSVKSPEEDYTYGEDLEKQIPHVIEMYKKDGFGTNQAYMAVGNAVSLLLNDPQCLRGVDTRVRYGKLHFMLYFRSWDLWAGFPSNLAALQMVKEWMAKEIGVEDGEIIASSKGLHLYDYAWDFAKKRLRKI